MCVCVCVCVCALTQWVNFKGYQGKDLYES